MPISIIGRRTIATALASAALLSACSDNTLVAPRSIAPTGRVSLDLQTGNDVLACKVAGPAGTYHFHMDASGGGDFTWVAGPDLMLVFDGVNRACEIMATATNQPSWDAHPLGTVTVTEVQIPAGIQVDSIITYNALNGGYSPAVTGTSSASAQFRWDNQLWFKFYNGPTTPPPPLGNQGCTPGYWKVRQHANSWVATGYTQAQLLSSVFNVPNTYTLNNQAMGGYTLLQALSFQGGSTLSGKAEILLRAAVAGLLNSSNNNISYPMTTAQLVSAVNAALASNDATTITNLATKIDGYNNGQGGCPLN